MSGERTEDLHTGFAAQLMGGRAARPILESRRPAILPLVLVVGVGDEVDDLRGRVVRWCGDAYRVGVLPIVSFGVVSGVWRVVVLVFEVAGVVRVVVAWGV